MSLSIRRLGNTYIVRKNIIKGTFDKCSSNHIENVIILAGNFLVIGLVGLDVSDTGPSSEIYKNVDKSGNKRARKGGWKK